VDDSCRLCLHFQWLKLGFKVLAQQFLKVDDILLVRSLFSLRFLLDPSPLALSKDGCHLKWWTITRLTTCSSCRTPFVASALSDFPGVSLTDVVSPCGYLL